VIRKTLQKIFKTIAYTFFEGIYGKIKNSITSSESENIKVKNVNTEKDLNYKVYKIINGRLYTDRIHDTAVILENKIIEGPSFQWRWSNEPKLYNSNIKNNVVFTKGTPRKLKKLNGTVLSLLTGGGANKNYWHWLFDSLPRIGLCDRAFGLSDIDYFLLQNHAKKFQIETLDCLNIPKQKRLSSEKFRHIKASELIVTDHPFIISHKATDDSMNVPGWISGWLKDNFLKKSTTTNKKNVKRIYIDRTDNTSETLPQRSIINEDEVKEYLLKKNFVSVKLHDIKFIDQVNLFHEAEIIVGLHGGGFANLAFCKPGTKVLELKSPESGPPIENLAKKNGLNYKSVTIKAIHIEELNFIHQHGAIEVPIEKLANALEN